jgi:hypothetical protein
MTLKTILLSAAVTLGMAACHHDKTVNTPANTTYAPSADQTQPAPTYGTAGTGVEATTPDVNGTGTNMNSNTTGTTPDQNTNTTAPMNNGTSSNETSRPAGAINSTDNASGNNSNNFDKNGARQNGNYNNSKNAVPSSTNGTNVNTDSDMDRTGNSGTTKEGNPGTATQPDR